MFSVSYPSEALRSSQISREDGRSCGNFETPLGYMGVLSLLIKISMSWNCVAVSELIYFTENQWIRLQSMRFISLFIFLNVVEYYWLMQVNIVDQLIFSTFTWEFFKLCFTMHASTTVSKITYLFGTASKFSFSVTLQWLWGSGRLDLHQVDFFYQKQDDHSQGG